MRRFARVSAAFRLLYHDSDKTPIARYCDSFWIAPVANPAFNGSYVGPVAAITRCSLCAHIRRPRLGALEGEATKLASSNRWFPFDVADEDYKVGGT